MSEAPLRRALLVVDVQYDFMDGGSLVRLMSSSPSIGTTFRITHKLVPCEIAGRLCLEDKTLCR